MTDKTLEKLLHLNLSDDWIRLKSDVFKRLLDGHDKGHVNTAELEGIDRQNWQVIEFVLYLLQQINQWLSEIEEQQLNFNEFSHKYRSAANLEQAREHIMTIAEQLSYSNTARNKIRRGKTPWLDENAIYDGHIKKQARHEQDIANTLERLGDIIGHLLSTADEASVSEIWRLLSLHSNLQRALEYHGNVHIRIESFKCLGKTLTVLQGLPKVYKHQIPANIIQYIYRTCLDEDINIWLRSEAISLVSQVEPRQFFGIISKLFVAQPVSDMYLRGRVVQQVCRYQQDTDDVAQAVERISLDPSDYVRQALVKNSIGLNDKLRLRLLKSMLQKEQCYKVRAQIYLTLTESLKDIAPVELHALQMNALAHESDDFALRALMHSLPNCVGILSVNQVESLHQALELLHKNNPKVAIRRWAVQTQEYMWRVKNPILATNDTVKLQQLPLHQSATIKVPDGVEPDELNRYLAVIGGERFGFDINNKGSRVTVRAGFKFGFRFWRFWHELRYSATDKRQNHSHLKGRLYYGMSQSTTRRMAEMSATKVPGEPLYINDEQGWRDYLPLLDQVISSLDQGWPTKPVKVYSAEGITAILPPSGLIKRLYARSVIQLKFAQLASLRNWQENDSANADEYIKQLNKLGFKVTISGYLDDNGQARAVDPKVQRFFSPASLPFVLPSVPDMQNYFYSVYQNTIGQLIAFTSIATVAYLGGHVAKLLKMRRHRKNIPLVIGGWGTRGKSGTERLKAALFNSMGLSVVSKTTGCEAMFLFGPANRPMKEMFLFRPYDKASIWEQVFLTGLTSKLGADVFLWECMGLTPRYIDIIQNQWMRDDLSTITNCYPDHEDLQGPAGIEIPIVMQRFVPRKSVLIASEESMLPLLEDAAREKKTSLAAVTWLEAGLLTDDIVQRFPYEEHPNNIALVAELARKLNIAADFAFKEMADNVVADLGVLKIYPIAEVKQRRLAFINGMSANERLGAMGNWQRTGLGEHTIEDEPNIWLGIVINNRSDRIARSKVFASMLVNDTQADCYFFIGNNLSGLQSYIDEEWQLYTANLNLTADNFILEASKFRIPVSEFQVLQRLQACLEGAAIIEEIPLKVEPQIVEQWQCDNQAITKLFNVDAKLLLEFNAHIADFNAEKALAWLYQSFKSKWVVVNDYYSSGNQTINMMVEHTPPGLTSRIIGMQNIKGTGLDFIYRWQAWNQVHHYCQILRTGRDEQALEDAALALTTWEEFGLLDKEQVIETLAIAKDRPQTQKEIMQAHLHLISQRLDKQLGIIEQSFSGQKKRSRLTDSIISAAESFLDAGDAIKRRKKADKIYQAILDNLISYDKASVELANITKAQKGGWLEQRFKQRLPSKN